MALCKSAGYELVLTYPTRTGGRTWCLALTLYKNVTRELLASTNMPAWQDDDPSQPQYINGSQPWNYNLRSPPPSITLFLNLLLYSGISWPTLRTLDIYTCLPNLYHFNICGPEPKCPNTQHDAALQANNNYDKLLPTGPVSSSASLVQYTQFFKIRT